jgi:hypothetical protein
MPATSTITPTTNKIKTFVSTAVDESQVEIVSNSNILQTFVTFVSTTADESLAEIDNDAKGLQTSVSKIGEGGPFSREKKGYP